MKNNDIFGVVIEPVARNGDTIGPEYTLNVDDMDTAPSENIFENSPAFTRQTILENPQTSTEKSTRTPTIPAEESTKNPTIPTEESTTEYKSVLLTAVNKMISREPRDTTVVTTKKSVGKTSSTTTTTFRSLTSPTTTTRRRIYETAKYVYHTTTSTLPSFFNFRYFTSKIVWWIF